MALERELEIYLSKLPELKAENEGKFVLIHGDHVIDIFSGYEKAITAGYGQFGMEPFLVKQIQGLEPARFISRFVDPCVAR
ncbi:MAG TPA: hypothetical protein VEW48_28905 [Thermoanaerobaculia bacterium]|nr:hypothetical protein [Thermoanaerobaculia bacterium]